MDDRVPGPLRETLATYSEMVEGAFPGAVAGIYLQGSIALDAFNERASDIDFVTVLERDVSRTDLARLKDLHRELSRSHPWSRRLEGIYVPRAGTTAGADLARRHPYVKRGMHAGKHPLGPTARRVLHRRAVALAGESPGRVVADVTDRALTDEMSFNVNVYWAGRAARPYFYLFDVAVDFAVTTLPRILWTLETGEIISKPQGVRLLLERFPELRSLAEEVRVRIEEGRRSGAGPVARLARMRATVRFIREMIERANAEHLVREPGPAR